MKILLSVFACIPGRGSEPGVGWGVVRHLAREHEVWALTNPANRAGLEPALAHEPLPNVHFIYVTLPGWATRLGWKPWYHQFNYSLWQFRALKAAQQIHKQVHFDLAQHVTYVNPWIPPLLGQLGIPFIWSAGNREPTPLRFMVTMSRPQAMAEVTRNFLLAASKPFSRVAARNSNTRVLTSSPQSRWGRGVNTIPFALGGLDKAELSLLASIPIQRAGPLRIASIGRFLGLKGFAMGLHAFARLHHDHPECEYWLVGEGPERLYLEKLARQLRIENEVKFIPWQPREAALQLLEKIDVLLHPSLHEQFSYVILEAMAAGKPVLCLDTGGPSILVDAGSGFKVPVSNPDLVVEELSTGLLHLADDPALPTRMGEHARQYALEHWNWESVTRRIMSIAEELSNSSSKLSGH